jgi:hypothetical protein
MSEVDISSALEDKKFSATMWYVEVTANCFGEGMPEAVQDQYRMILSVLASLSKGQLEGMLITAMLQIKAPVEASLVIEC